MICTIDYVRWSHSQPRRDHYISDPGSGFAGRHPEVPALTDVVLFDISATPELPSQCRLPQGVQVYPKATPF